MASPVKKSFFAQNKLITIPIILVVATVLIIGLVNINQIDKQAVPNEKIILDGPPITPPAEVIGRYDNLVYVNTGPLGAGQLWTKKNGQWIIIHESQNLPPCELLEKEKVGKGMQCVDYEIPSVRTVDY